MEWKYIHIWFFSGFLSIHIPKDTLWLSALLNSLNVWNSNVNVYSIDTFRNFHPVSTLYCICFPYKWMLFLLSLSSLFFKIFLSQYYLHIYIIRLTFTNISQYSDQFNAQKIYKIFQIVESTPNRLPLNVIKNVFFFKYLCDAIIL